MKINWFSEYKEWCKHLHIQTPIKTLISIMRYGWWGIWFHKKWMFGFHCNYYDGMIFAWQFGFFTINLDQNWRNR